jgi:hypothetical protein
MLKSMMLDRAERRRSARGRDRRKVRDFARTQRGVSNELLPIQSPRTQPWDRNIVELTSIQIAPAKKEMSRLAVS